MNRLLPALLIALFSCTAHTQDLFEEGRHYQVVSEGQPFDASGKIEVVEVFWYGCPSCFSFEPHIERWVHDLPDDVSFVRIAASMSPSWRVHARAFYAAEALGALAAVHGPLFRALHIEHRRMEDGEAMVSFFVEQGVDEAEFRRTWSSFGVETRMRRGDQFTRRHRLTGVPAVIVAGKYRTDVSMTQSYERLIELIDFLVAKERQSIALASAG